MNDCSKVILFLSVALAFIAGYATHYFIHEVAECDTEVYKAKRASEYEVRQEAVALGLGYWAVEGNGWHGNGEFRWGKKP